METIDSKTINFIKRSKEIHGELYDYRLVKYINNKTNVSIICDKHGEYEISPNLHLSKKRGCKKCSLEKRINNIRITRLEFIKRAKEIHGDKYDYELVNFENTHSSIKIKCKHGVFEQKVYNHLQGKGCKKCYFESKVKDIDFLKQKSIEIYSDIYDYSKFEYINSKTKSIIRCQNNHEYLVTPNRILSGKYKCLSCKTNNYQNNWLKKLESIKNFKYKFQKGEMIEIECLLCLGKFKRKTSTHFKLKNCIFCNPNSLDKEKFIEKSKEIHNGYDYSLVEYNGSRNKVKLICDKNHKFEQIVNNHLNGIGCPICNRFDKKENEIYDFIKDNYNSEIIKSDRSILYPKELDIYLPDLKLALEFNGVYWHSELYKEKNYHSQKTKDCLEQGINLIHIWEDDWQNKKEIVKSIILNKLGKSNRIFARNCKIIEITDNRLVRQFLEENHIQGFVGSKIKLGLYFNEELISLMTFGDLRKSLGQNSKNGHFELLRFCNKINTTVIGGASKLFKYFINKYKPSEIISYSDNSRGNGNMYEKLGFNILSETVPNYYWVVDGVRKNRFNFRKDKLIKEGADPNKTEKEIMSEKGYYRIFDCGSKKWLYKNKI